MAQLSIIKDPLTGQQFSRDTGSPGSLYSAYTPTAPPPTEPAAAPTAPVPSPIKVKRTVDPAAQADNFLGTFVAPKSADQIAEEMRRGSQGAIDAINKTYDDQVAAKGVIGQERLAQDNAISVLSGLTGSTEAGRTRGATLDKNSKEVQAVNNERLLQLQSLYTKISQDAREEARLQREDATKSANDIVARRAASQTKAVENIKLMAAGGLVDFDSFKNSPQNSEVYKHALEAVGGSETALKGLFAINRPKDQLVGSPVRVGDHFIQAYQNPLTGKIAYDTVEVPGGLPTEYKNFQKIGDNLVAIPDGWDGDMSKLKTIYAGSSVSGGGGEVLPGNPFNAQPSYAKLTAGQKKQADSLNNLVRSLSEYRTTFEQETDKSGGKLFGEGAAILESKLNSIIFAAAQAEGTGALQQADREVIEKIIPNPTTLSGAIGAAFKGGQKGSLGKIDDQINKYTNNLATYGLQPVGASSSQPSASNDPVKAAVGSTVEINGVQYKKVGDDAFEPI
jgi:hypothetical protein